VQCSWASLEASPDPRGTYDRAALLVPVSIGESEGFLQLDTGAVSSRLYKEVADLFGLPYDIISELSELPPEQGRVWRAAVRSGGGQR
jgi:hypothetical protein